MLSQATADDPKSMYVICSGNSYQKKFLWANFRLVKECQLLLESCYLLYVTFSPFYHLTCLSQRRLLYFSWTAILVYDYCLTLFAEVETCWGVGKLNWGLGLFYLNRYLTLFGYIPVMVQHFGATSNPNKTEVSILLPSSRGRKMLKPIQMLVSGSRE